MISDRRKAPVADPCFTRRNLVTHWIEAPLRKTPMYYINLNLRSLNPQKICHAGRLDDPYHRHSAFDSSESFFFESKTRTRKCLGAYTMSGHVDFKLGYSFVAVSWFFVCTWWVSSSIYLLNSYCFNDSKNYTDFNESDSSRWECGQPFYWDFLYHIVILVFESQLITPFLTGSSISNIQVVVPSVQVLSQCYQVNRNLPWSIFSTLAKWGFAANEWSSGVKYRIRQQDWDAKTAGFLFPPHSFHRSSKRSQTWNLRRPRPFPAALFRRIL